MSKKQKEVDAINEKLPKNESIAVSEIGKNDAPIERMSENDFAKDMEMEVFMNQLLTVIVHPSTEEGSLPVVTPNVNGINQPIIRGVQSKVKRKYVEALARSRITKYKQRVPNPMRPENIQMDENTVLTYPFSVIEDPHPDGRVWLEAILAQK